MMSTSMQDGRSLPVKLTNKQFSVSLGEIFVERTYQAEMSPKPYARLQYALTARRSPIRAAMSQSDWCDVGQVMFVPPHTSVSMIVPAGNYDTMQLTYSTDMLEQDALIQSALLDKSGKALNLRSKYISMDLLRLIDILRRPELAQGSVIDAACNMILNEAARTLTYRTEMPISGGLAPWRMRLITDRIRDEAMPAPTISELADMCDLSNRHLMRAFTQETGETIGKVIRRYAIERAKKQLMEGDEPIGNIGLDIGFSTPASFAFAFKRSVGMLPSEFRSRQRSGGVLIG